MEKRKPNTRITLRIPPDIHEALLELSKYSGESLNSEIINRIRDSLSNEPPQIITTTESILRKVIREELSNNPQK